MKPRPTYITLRTGFTPFVSVALLLIVFFVGLIVVAEPNVLGVWGVQGSQKDIEPKRPKHTLEILLGNNDTIQFCYFPTGSVCRSNFIETNRHSAKLRETLLRYRKEALTPGELAIVILP